MHVTRRIHVGQYVVLQFRNRLQRIWHVLILLDVADHLCSLRTLGEVDEVGLLDQRGNTILNERQISEVDTCLVSTYLENLIRVTPYRRKECTEGSPYAMSPDSR